MPRIFESLWFWSVLVHKHSASFLCFVFHMLFLFWLVLMFYNLLLLHNSLLSSCSLSLEIMWASTHLKNIIQWYGKDMGRQIKKIQWAGLYICQELLLGLMNSSQIMVIFSPFFFYFRLFCIFFLICTCWPIRKRPLVWPEICKELCPFNMSR